MLKKILVIGYGGTIVMVVDEAKKTIVPAKNLDEIKKLIPNLNEAAEIEMDFLSNKDSTNVFPEDWTKIAYYIYERMDKYDAFVITHGTNTMAYTASALALVFGANLPKPIVITGSQLPLSVYGNDARFNFENAVKTAIVAADEKVAEVMIVFDDVILRGSRAIKISESSFKAFDSPATQPIGMITSTGIHFNQLAKRKISSNPIDFKPHFSHDIISIDITPGQLPSIIEAVVAAGKCKGVIIKSHGAGSVPTEGEFSYLPTISKIVNQYKVPIIISTKFLGGNAYKEINDEPATLAIEAGAISGGDLTYVMTEVKLMWLLAQGITSEQEVRKYILKDYVGEVTPINK